MSSPTQRSLALLRKRGGIVGIVERYNHIIRQRFDLFGFADLVYCEGDTVTLIQTTSRANLNARIDKIKANANALYWLQGRNHHIQAHGWSKKGKRGKAKRWVCDAVCFSLLNPLNPEAGIMSTPIPPNNPNHTNE